MIRIEELKAVISDSGMTTTAIAGKIGMSRETFYNRLENPENFKMNEVQKLSQTLHLKPEEFEHIFLA